MPEYNIKQLLSCGKVFYRMATVQQAELEKSSISNTGYEACTSSSLPGFALSQVSQDQCPSHCRFHPLRLPLL